MKRFRMPYAYRSSNSESYIVLDGPGDLDNQVTWSSYEYEYGPQYSFCDDMGDSP